MRVIAKAAVAQPAPEPRCIACLRTRDQLTIGRLEFSQIPDHNEREWLCSDPTDCRRSWPPS